MYVRWKKRRRLGAGNRWSKDQTYTLWTAQLVESSRPRPVESGDCTVDRTHSAARGSPRQVILATLASIDTAGPQAQHPVVRAVFWLQVDKRLAVWTLQAVELAAIEGRLMAVVPRPTQAELAAIAPDVWRRLEQRTAAVTVPLTPSGQVRVAARRSANVCSAERTIVGTTPGSIARLSTPRPGSAAREDAA